MSTTQSKLQGLSEEEVIRNREQFGENLLTPPEKESIWKLYLEKFKDPVIKVLLFAAMLSLGISIIENERITGVVVFHTAAVDCERSVIDRTVTN